MFEQVINEVLVNSRFNKVATELPNIEIVWIKDSSNGQLLRIEVDEDRIAYTLFTPDGENYAKNGVTNYDHFVGYIIKRL